MVMPPCGTFDYLATVASCRSLQRTWTFGSGPLEQLRPTGDRRLDSRLVGYSPLVELSRGKLTLRALHRSNAQVLAASFEVHCSLMSVLRCHDRLHLVRANTGDLAVSVVRDDRLVLAFGAVTRLQLGSNASVSVADRGGVDIYIGGATKTLTAGERVDLMGYHLWVGSLESVAISDDDVCPAEVAVQSAKLVARPGALGLVSWPD
jgi:hypothetical protein